MADQVTEEIPHQYLLTEMELMLHTRTSELTVANARIRTRDVRIEQLVAENKALRYRVEQRHDPEIPPE